MGKIANIINILKKLYFVLTKQQKQRACIVFIVTILSSIFELFGITMILPFVQAIVEPDIVMNNSMIDSVATFFGCNDAKSVLLLIGLLLIIVYILKNAFLIFSSYVQYAFSSRVQMELSNNMLAAYMGHTYEFFLDINTADVVRGCDSDVDGVYHMVNGILQLLAEILAILFIGIYLVYTEPFIAIGALMVMLIILVIMILVFKPIMKTLGITQRNVRRDKNKILLQIVNGIKEIFVSQRKELFGRDYRIVANKYRKSIRIGGTLANVPDRITEGVCVGGIIGVVCVRLAFTDIDTMATMIPTIATFAVAAFKLLPSIGKITNRINSIVTYMPCLDNLYVTIKTAEAISEEESQYIDENNNEEHASIYNTITFEHELNLVDVVWKYYRQEEYVLNGLNLKIKKGQSVGLIGPSGAGKTTLSDIILGLLKPRIGNILMDGIDIFTIPQLWANIVGYVPQTVFLTDDSIRNNVVFGMNNGPVIDGDVWNALEQAQIANFVKGLPEGLDTMVGERGIRLSGGQRQRLVIARALYNKPQILVLDEATASLDNDTEAAVMEAIDSLQGQITTIIIAHRLTTIRNCDIIYEVKDGVATERRKEDIF